MSSEYVVDIHAADSDGGGGRRGCGAKKGKEMGENSANRSLPTALTDRSPHRPPNTQHQHTHEDEGEAVAGQSVVVKEVSRVLSIVYLRLLFLTQP